MESRSRFETVKNSLWIAFAMYSKIPVPQADWKQENMKYTMCFFPLVGAVIGALLYGLLWIEQVLGAPVPFQALTAVAVPMLLTGGIHMDGFLDVSDALHSYLPKEEKLRIMEDPHVGSFAVIGALLWLISDYALWASVDLSAAAVLAWPFILSRILSALLVVTVKRSKENGMNAQMSEAAHKQMVKKVLFAELVLCVGAMLYLHPILGLVAFAVAGAVFFYVRQLAYKQFGGMSGDVAGYFLQLCELMMLLGIVAAQIIERWMR